MIEYFVQVKGKDKIEKVDSFVTGCWINVSNPNEEEIIFLIENFNLTRESIIDGLDIHEMPRFEIDNKQTYVYLTAPTSRITHEHDSSFLIVYGKNYFLTLSKSSLEIFDSILNLKKNFKGFSRSKNLVRVLFLLSRSFEESVNSIRKEIKRNKTDLNKLKNTNIEKLINYEDKLNGYISSFGSTISTYNRILRDKSLTFMKRDEEIISDLIIDLNETLELCRQTLKSISNMRDYYSTKLSNDLNKTVTLLTVFTIFLSIPTLLASIYGMNVPLPFENSLRFIWIFGILIFGIWGSMYMILKRLKLI